MSYFMICRRFDIWKLSVRGAMVEQKGRSGRPGNYLKRAGPWQIPTCQIEFHNSMRPLGRRFSAPQSSETRGPPTGAPAGAHCIFCLHLRLMCLCPLASLFIAHCSILCCQSPPFSYMSWTQCHSTTPSHRITSLPLHCLAIEANCP